MIESKTPRELFRHTVATLAYRGSKALRGAPPEFAGYRASPTTRTPIRILAHLGDLLEWALCMAREKSIWRDAPPQAWDQEVARFYLNLHALDEFLAGSAPLATPVEILFQGPIADALTHVGQLNLLRRMHGAPVKGESYARAAIECGRVGPDQVAPDPKAEFE